MKWLIHSKLNQSGFDHILMAVAFIAIIGIVGAGYVTISTKNHTTTQGVAHAASFPEICAQAGKGYCLNDWNGSSSNGAPVKMYNSGVSNDSFSYILLAGYCNGGYVTSNCPFAAGPNFSTEFVGDEIFEIQDNNNGKCIGTNTSEGADMGPCPAANGSSRGSNLWVKDSYANCLGSNGFYTNVYWTNYFHNDVPYSLISGGSIGAQAHIYNAEAGSCWGTPNQ